MRPPCLPAPSVSLLIAALATLFWAMSAQAAPPTKASGLTNAGVAPDWTRKVSESAGAQALFPMGDRLIALSWKGSLVGIDARTGRIKWRDKPPKQQPFGETMAAQAGERVVIMRPGLSALRALDRGGAERWQVELPSEPQSLMACPGHRLVAATHRGRAPDGRQTLIVHALDPVDGRSLWKAPAAGPLVGAGADHLFMATPSGRGRLMSGLTAVRCVDGQVTEVALPEAAREHPYVRFLDAGGDLLISAHGPSGSSWSTLCVTPLGRGGQGHCFGTTDGQVARYPIDGALFIPRYEELYFSTSHIEAHNLNAAPDAWLFAINPRLAADPPKVRWRTLPMTAGVGAVDAGALLLTAFGTTGADDYAYLVDPANGSRVATLSLPKAPSAMAVDEKRAYIATYDGTVRAMTLPLPGPSAGAERVVQPQDSARTSDKGQASAVAWKVERTIDAVPKTARTSGNKVAGDASAVTFLGADRLVVGSNDDKVRVIDRIKGRAIWTSKKLGKDVTSVSACAGDRFAARIYSGAMFLYGPKGRKFKRQSKINQTHGWGLMSYTSGCETLVADTLNNSFDVYREGQKRATVDVRGFRDARGLKVNANRLIDPEDGQLHILDISSTPPARVGSVPWEKTVEGLNMTQAWMVSPDLLLTEHCAPGRCQVRLIPMDGGAPRTLDFDIRGSVWVPTVPSRIVVDPQAKTLVFARTGLTPELVELASNTRTSLTEIAGRPTQNDAPGFAFGPDGRLAIGGWPAPWQITVLTRR